MPDPHFQVFAETLKEAIAQYPRLKETRLQTQRRQLETLLDLEDQWRKLLCRHRWGEGVYRDFVYYVCDQPLEPPRRAPPKPICYANPTGGKRNILAARPFFRERQTAFTATIADVLKERRHRDLMGYRVNYIFIAWVLGARRWDPRSPIRTLAARIEALRREIMVQNMPLAISRARIFWGRTPKSHLSFMDMVGVAAGGLLAGIDKFVPALRPGMTEDQILAEYKRWRSVVMGRIGGDQIASYSETFLHFFPKDQRRLYRANKVLHYFAGNVDYEELAKLVNENLEPAQQTTPAEIADLLAAAGTVSLDAQPVHGHDDGDDDEAPESRYEAPVDTRPDVRVEEAESAALLGRAIQGLSAFQRKILRMKGVQA